MFLVKIYRYLFHLFVHLVTISLALNVSSQEIRRELDTVFALEGSQPG